MDLITKLYLVRTSTIVSYLVIRFDYTDTKDFAAAQRQGFDLKVSGGQLSTGSKLSTTGQLDF